MANTTKPLTNTEIKQSKPKAKEYNLADGGGLSLRVKPNGSKQWVFNYSRPFTKKRANIGFGSYPVVALAEARKKRINARELLAKEIDPKDHKDEQDALQCKAHNGTLEHVAGRGLKSKE